MARQIRDDIAGQLASILPDVDFASVRVHETAQGGRITRLLLRARIEAVCIGRHIVVTGRLNESSVAGQGLLAHELTHVRQIQERGLVRFFAAYLAAYLGGRRRGLSHEAAYRANPFEQEAYRTGALAVTTQESRLVAIGSPTADGGVSLIAG